MPTHSDLNPAELKPGLTTPDGLELKPSLVTPAYTGGTPSAANQIKPNLRNADGSLKAGLLTPDGLALKPSLVAGGGGGGPVVPDPVVPGEITLTQEILHNENVAIAMPITRALTPVPSATGCIVFVSMGGLAPIKVTVNGVEAKQVSCTRGLAEITNYARSVTYGFYSTQTTGDVVVSTDFAYNSQVVLIAYSVTGGTLRSFSYVGEDIPLTGVTATKTLATEWLDEDVSIGILTGNGVSTPSPSFTSRSGWALGDWCTGNINTRRNAIAGSGNVSTTVQGTSTRAGFGVLVASQIPQTKTAVASPIMEEYVYPLNHARSSAVVPVTGTYTGTASAIEARVIDDTDAVVVDWTTVAASPSGGTFSGSLTVPSHTKLCKTQVRFVGQPTTASTQQFGWYTGLRVVAMGQSNMTGFFGNIESTFASDAKTVIFNCQSQRFEGRGLGDGGRQFAMSFNSFADNLPVMVIHSTKPGAGSEEFVPGMTTFTQLEDAVDKLGPIVHAIMWHQGEGEGNANLSIDVPAYAGRISSIHAAIAGFNGLTEPDIPFVLSSLTTYGAVTGIGDINAKWTAVDECHKSLPGLLTNVHWSDSWKDCSRKDDFHAYGQGHARRAVRVAHHIAYQLGYQPTPGRFDIATTEALTGTTTKVVVAHSLGTDIEIKGVTHLAGNSNLTDETVITGFEVSEDDWATFKPCSGVRTNATTITLTHDPISTSGRKLRYLYGRNPDVSGIVRDNGPLHSVLTHEATLDVDEPASAATATGGTVTDSGGYRIHAFTTVGTEDFVVSGGTLSGVEWEVYGDGGGGGDAHNSSSTPAGGGGAGGLVTNVGSPAALAAGSYPVTVGPGGLGATVAGNGQAGSGSTFNGLTAQGGGAGGMVNATSGLNGGCGGGLGGTGGTARAGGVGTQGGNGGAVNIPTAGAASGGGGIGGDGQSPSTYSTPANGGPGLVSAIDGVTRGGGGGGGGSTNMPGGAGGSGGIGGGGAGGVYGGADAASAAANTGGGGGGGKANQGPAAPGGNGGSGIVLIRYPI